MKLRVGLVGLGDAWEQRHRPALCALADRYEVRAVCEQVGYRAKHAAAEFSVTPVDGFRTLTMREDIDAILMLAPQWYGSLPILAACESGKAVYCCAGLNLKPEETQLIKRRVDETGIVFIAEFPRRLSPATLRLKELIATRLGQPRLLFCHQRRAVPSQVNQPGNSCASGPATGELVEMVDWCCYVVDREPAWVTGLMHQSAAEGSGEDYQMMSLDFSPRECPGSGPVAQISCGWYIPGRWQEVITYRPLAALQVSGERGIAFVDLPSTLIWFDEAGRHQESLETERPVGEQLQAQSATPGRCRPGRTSSPAW